MATKPRGDTRKRPAVGTGGHRPVNGKRRPGTGGYRVQNGKGGGGMGVVFILVLLVAGGAGAGWAFRDEIFGPSEIKPVTIPDTTTEPPVKQPVVPPVKQPVVPPIKQPVVPPVKQPPATPDNGRAEKAIADGQGLLAALKYGTAASAFGRVGGMKCSKALGASAGDLERKARTFEKLAGEVKVRVDAGKKLQIVTTVKGDEVRGVVTKLPNGSYRVVQGASGAGQMIYTFAADDIKSFKDVDPAVRAAELRGELAKRVSRLGAKPPPAGLVDAAVFAIENGLKRDSHGLLERAWTGAEKMRNGSGKDLSALVSEHRARKLFTMANWYLDAGQEIFARKYCTKIRKDYKGTSLAPAADELLAMMDRRKGIKRKTGKEYKVTYVIDAPPPPSKTIDAVRTLPPAGNGGTSAPKVTASRISSKGGNLSEANRLFQEGLQFYIKGRPGNPNSNYNLSQASKRFRKARKIYERAAKADPGNSSLQSRLTDLNRNIYACAKMSTL